jgi:hypothetical protein
MSQRHSTLMQVTARWLLLGLTIAVLPGCETTSDGAEPAVGLVADVAADPATPRFEPSQVIRETFVSDAEPYCPPGRDNCCPTWLTDLGTEVPTEDVAAFFERLGFDDGSNLTRLTHDPSHDWNPGWSPDEAPASEGRPEARRRLKARARRVRGGGGTGRRDTIGLKSTETTDHRRSQRGRRIGPLFSWEVPSVFFASLS